MLRKVSLQEIKGSLLCPTMCADSTPSVDVRPWIWQWLFFTPSEDKHLRYCSQQFPEATSWEYLILETAICLHSSWSFKSLIQGQKLKPPHSSVDMGENRFPPALLIGSLWIFYGNHCLCLCVTVKLIRWSCKATRNVEMVYATWNIEPIDRGCI